MKNQLCDKYTALALTSLIFLIFVLQLFFVLRFADVEEAIVTLRESADTLLAFPESVDQVPIQSKLLIGSAVVEKAYELGRFSCASEDNSEAR